MRGNWKEKCKLHFLKSMMSRLKYANRGKTAWGFYGNFGTWEKVCIRLERLLSDLS